MEANDNRDSPYITTWGLVPPSPTRSIEFDHTSPFDSAFGITDSNIQGSNPLASPGYQNTPSYNGSYYNSPFSQHSELVDIDFLQDLPSGSTATSGVDYEPSEYETPNQGGSLLMFPTDQDFISPHYSPSDAQRTRSSPFDHHSPGSSPGLDDKHRAGRHSRASSVASNQHSPSAPQAAAISPQPTFQPSRIDALSSFGNMSVHTPNWASQPLPNAHSPHAGTESQQQKPQSPPRLTLPPGMTFGSEATAVPKINAPNCKEEEGVMFSIEPATPVGGGDAGVRQHTPFQQTLETLTQGVPLVISDDDINSQQYQQPQQPSQHPSPFGSPRVTSNELSNADYLYHDTSGIRQGRHTDGWQDGPFMDNSQNHLGPSETPFGVQQPPRVRNIDDQHRQQLQTFTFGGSGSPSGDPIRRAVSDSLAAPRYHRHSRSEEIRPIPTSPNPPGYHGQSNSIGGTGTQFLFPPSSHTDFIQRQQQGQFLHPNDLPSSTSTPGLPQGLRSLSPGMGHIRRASSGSRAGRGAEVWGTQADLSPHPNTLGVRRMSPYPTPNASPRVNYSELDELNELNLGNVNNNANNLGMGSGLGLGVGVSAVGVDGIPGIGEPPVSAGYSEEVSITGRNAYGRDDASSVGHHRAESATSAHAPDGGPVMKQNVTTGRTANASIKRRKQEANFACTVPGCGSTFTRGFNLKGHMRSHWEQKPFKCHWPGCDKGFARQHDCKRHEQLHSNYRPFICDGCGKNFARMDALNRHLRSEAGADCAKAAEEKKGDEMDADEDEKKPQLLLDPPPPSAPSGRRRNNTDESRMGSPPSAQTGRRKNHAGESGMGSAGMLGLPDDLWGVSV